MNLRAATSAFAVVKGNVTLESSFVSFSILLKRIALWHCLHFARNVITDWRGTNGVEQI